MTTIYLVIGMLLAACMLAITASDPQKEDVPIKGVLIAVALTVPFWPVMLWVFLLTWKQVPDGE